MLYPSRNNSRCLEVHQSIKRAFKNFERDVNCIHAAQDVIDFVRNNIPQFVMLEENYELTEKPTPMARVHTRFPAYSVPEIEMIFLNTPYDQVVEWIGGPIHRAFGCLWELDSNVHGVELKSYIFNRHIEIKIILSVRNSSVIGCRFVEEPELIRYTYKNYRMICT